MPNTHQYVLQAVAVARGVVHVVGRHDAHAQVLGQRGQLPVERVVFGQQVVLELDPEAFAAKQPESGAGGVERGGLIAAQQRRGDLPSAAAGQRDEAVGVAFEVGGRQRSLAFGRMAPRPADQPAQVAPAGLVLDQQRQVVTTLSASALRRGWAARPAPSPPPRSAPRRTPRRGR